MSTEDLELVIAEKNGVYVAMIRRTEEQAGKNYVLAVEFFDSPDDATTWFHRMANERPWDMLH